MEAPIKIKDSKNEYFLPILSPIFPKIKEPMGLNMNDEATTVNVSKKCDEPSAGKDLQKEILLK